MPRDLYLLLKKERLRKNRDGLYVNTNYHEGCESGVRESRIPLIWGAFALRQILQNVSRLYQL